MLAERRKTDRYRGSSRGFGSAYSQFVVLYPQIALDDFGRRQKSQNRCISIVETAATFFPILRQQSGAGGFRGGHRQSFLDKGAPVGGTPEAIQ
jgi:hypothetical protein